MKTFLLAGHGGFYNRGCEAIVRTTVSLLRERFGDVRIFLSSFDWERDRDVEIGEGVALMPAVARRWSVGWGLRQWGKLSRTDWVWRGALLPLRRRLGDADAVLSIGGDNYTMDDGRYPWYVMGLNRLVSEAGRPLVIWAASIGPFPPGDVLEAAMASLRKASLVTVRESMSFSYLAEHGLSSNVRLVADPAFLLRPQPVDVSAFWPDTDDVVGINVSPLLGRYHHDKSDAPILGTVAELIRKCTSSYGLGVLLVPHVTSHLSGSDDCTTLCALLAASANGARVALAPPNLDAAETKHVISQCRFFVGARTHATIAALSSAVPTISLAYSQKALGMNQDVFGHRRFVVDTRTVAGNELLHTFHTLVREEDGIRSHLRLVVPDMTARARSGVEYLAETLLSTKEPAHA